MNRLVVIVALCAVLTTGCSWFRLESVPPQVEEAFRNGGDPSCTPNARRAERVATGVDERDGAEVELWLAPTDDGGDAIAVLLTEPGQDRMGMGSFCAPQRDDRGPLACCGIGMSGAGGIERSISFGQAPPEAATIRAGGGADATLIDVGASGYFVVVQSRQGDGDNVMAMADPTLTALDEDGNELER